MVNRKSDPLDDALFEMLVKQGKPYREIGEACGMTEEAARQRAHREGIPRPTFPKHVVSRISSQDGLLHRIAARAGLSPERDTVPLPVEESTLDAWLSDPR